jgi:hypothetical protein
MEFPDTFEFLEEFGIKPLEEYPSMAYLRYVKQSKDGGHELDISFSAVVKSFQVVMRCYDLTNVEHSVKIDFVKPRAFRKRAEIYCKGFHLEAYDTVCEIEDSEWVAELRNDSVPEWRYYWVMRHFMVYLDGFGCLEVIAESVSFEDNVVMNSGAT